jgi:hypothetical protein
MDGSVVSSPRGAEISERSHELVLPDEGGTETRSPLRGRIIGVSERHGTTQPVETSTATRPNSHEQNPNPSEQTRSRKEEAELRGAALPGDRGPRDQPRPAQRPSFWRRIALGRRNHQTDSAAASTLQESTATTVATPKTQIPVRRELTRELTNSRETQAVETRIVEPLLQALVSVEAKLERSHSELVGRSDHVEQRLTQLWDIEEQLGTLGELQESLLQVSEQQRRLESAIVTQTQTLRWLVGAVFFSLAAAAFVVAAILR